MLKVMVVEASREVRAKVADVLCELEGVHVHVVAEDAATAIPLLAAAQTHLVIAGAGLSEHDKEDLIAGARAHGVRDVVVVDAPSTEPRWRAAGATSVVGQDLDALAVCVIAIARDHAEREAREQEQSEPSSSDEDPLTAADLYLTGIPAGARKRDRLRRRTAQRALQAGSQLAARLLAHARDEARPVEEVALAPTLEAMLPYLQHLIPEGIELRVLAELDTPRVRCVAAEVEGLVLNLVLDASERLPWGGTIWIAVERDGADNVRLEVLDSSAGSTARPGRRAALDVARPEIERHGGRLHGGAGVAVQLVLPTA